MTAILRNRKLVLVHPNDYYFPPRSEGKIKTYDSCTDIRAWSLHEDERSDHLFDLIKIDNGPCRGFIPKNVLAEMITTINGSGPKTGDVKSFTNTSTSKDVPQRDFVGDSSENEKKLKKIIAEKDKEISTLKNDIVQIKKDCDNGDMITRLQGEINKLNEENQRYKNIATVTSKEPLEDSNEQKLKIAELENMIKELKKEKDLLSEKNAQCIQDLKQLNENAKSSQGVLVDPSVLEEKDKKIAELENEIKELKKENAKPVSSQGVLVDPSVLEEKDKKIAELEKIIKELKKERDKLLEDNAQLADDFDQISEHIESISNLKMELADFSTNAKLMFDNGDKYRRLLEETLKMALEFDAEKAKASAKDLQKKRKHFEEQIKAQLEELLQIYIKALEEIDEKHQELEKLKAELEAIKKLNEDLKKNCNQNDDSTKGNISSIFHSYDTHKKMYSEKTQNGPEEGDSRPAPKRKDQNEKLYLKPQALGNQDIPYDIMDCCQKCRNPLPVSVKYPECNCEKKTPYKQENKFTNFVGLCKTEQRNHHVPNHDVFQSYHQFEPKRTKHNRENIQMFTNTGKTINESNKTPKMVIETNKVLLKGNQVMDAKFNFSDYHLKIKLNDKDK